MFELLKDIREVALIHLPQKRRGRKPKKRPKGESLSVPTRDRVLLSSMSDEQKTLFNLLKLGRYLNR